MTGTDDPRAAGGTAMYRRTLLALFCAGFATFSQIYSPQGLLPEIAVDFGVDAGTSSWALGASTIGVAVWVIPWARLSDRIGRVAAMRWALLSAMVAGLSAPLMPGFEAFIAARFLEGVLLSGLPAIAVTAVAETVRLNVLGTTIGIYVAGNTIGGLSGRIIAAEVGELWGWRAGLIAVAVIAAIGILVFVVIVPPTVVHTPPAASVWRGLLANLKSPGVMVLVIQPFLLMGGFVAIYNYLAFRLQQPPFDLTLAQVSWLFLAYLAGALVSSWIWKIIGNTPPVTVMLVCVAVMLAGLGLTLLPSLWAVIAGLLLFTGAFFGTHSIASALINRRADVGRSLATPLYNLGYYAGSSLLGWLGGVAFAGGGWAGTVAMTAGAAVLAAVLLWAHARWSGDVERS